VARRGADSYLGEPVTIGQHMLQAAHLAESEGAGDDLVAAALLHDIGHYTSEFGTYSPDDTEDRHHDEAGAEVLAPFFPPVVTECVRLHVAAKRYLCATDPGYFARLSPASVHTLSLQGGPMSAEEIVRFERNPYHREAVRVRVWDEGGKVAGMKTRAFADYAPMLQRVVDAA
ncbi:MAG TPA: HD domain-containing protein, partial [Hyphomicrobiales bacterium]|nr:HD domain-containing protein [Hyphomicrobiales bacterium]